jgi:hypothetical protein
MLGLLAAAGCNQIWGLGQVGLAPPDDPDPRVQLRLQIAKTTPDKGALDSTLEYRPITPMPAVEIGLVGEPLEPGLAIYDEADGTVQYPLHFVGQRWRLVYTLAGGVPREVQWSPPDGGEQPPQLVEPLFGRFERRAVPANSGYAITPTTAPLSHTQTRVYTTGIWTESVFGPFAGGTFNYDFANAISLSGPRGAPEKDKLDHAVLAHFVPSTPMTSVNCLSASRVATFEVPDLVEGNLVPPAMQPTYYVADKQLMLRLTSAVPIDSRLRDVLDMRAAPINLNRMSFGYVPSTDMLGFSKPITDFLLPGPVMIAFATCTFPQGTPSLELAAVADPPELRPLFPQVVHVEIANQRTRDLVTLTSGFSAVVASGNYEFLAGFPVAAPMLVKLQRGGAPIADLDEDADGQTLPAGEGPLELTFDVEPGISLGADYFDVTLYALQGDKLAKQRVYTVTDRKVTLDLAPLRSGTEYVFEIRSYRGLSQISLGNFASARDPQYAATIFTRTFKAP